MWQRGLTLFYAERLQDAMDQFSNDVVRLLGHSLTRTALPLPR